MKATGIVRRMDDLGRVVIPVELRRTLGLSDGDSIEIFTEGQLVLLKRYEPLCTFCGNSGPMTVYHGKQICQGCCSQLGAPSVR